MSEELRPEEIEETEHPEDCTCGCHDHDHEGHEHHHHDHDHEGHHHDHEHHHHDHEGHEHHHHHDHDHEHHHHHHDDECGCHDHHHDHDHHDFHEHDHHDHDHGHTYEVEGYKVVETHNHEGATICSFEKDLKKQTAEVKPLMEAAIKELEAWLDAEGALIGHVKGYIREGGPVTTFSTTGNGLNVEAHEGGGVAVGFAAIVFGPEEEVLKDKVLEVFKNL